MLYLSLCAINNTKPDIGILEKIDLDALFKECQRHNITALVCYALESVTKLPRVWSEAKGKAIRKSMLFDAEREKITDFMNENGIKYMLLKGILLKELYPEIGMREMSDNDIYYDMTFRDRIEDFMLSCQYKSAGKADDHDIYEKEPIYNFEFHNSLFLKEASVQLHDYYLDIEKRMIKDDDNAYGFHLSNEDLYIYLIAHEYKHYNYCGTGVRSLLDCIVFLKAYDETLNWQYIDNETKKAGIYDFEKKQRELCRKLTASFVDTDFSQDEVDFLEYLVSSGVHGTYETGVLNKATGKVEQNTKVTFSMKVKYIFRRLFPPMSFYKRFYPFFYKHKYLLPLFVLFRMFKAIFKPSSVLKTEINILNK